MRLKNLLLLFISLLLNLSCSEEPPGNADLLQNDDSRKNEGDFIVNELGDTIPTGVPISAQGKRIDPDSVAKPKTVPLQGTPISRACPYECASGGDAEGGDNARGAHNYYTWGRWVLITKNLPCSRQNRSCSSAKTYSRLASADKGRSRL